MLHLVRRVMTRLKKAESDRDQAREDLEQARQSAQGDDQGTPDIGQEMQGKPHD